MALLLFSFQFCVICVVLFVIELTLISINKVYINIITAKTLIRLLYNLITFNRNYSETDCCHSRLQVTRLPVLEASFPFSQPHCGIPLEPNESHMHSDCPNEEDPHVLP